MKFFSIAALLLLQLVFFQDTQACGKTGKQLLCCNPDHLIRHFNCCCFDKNGLEKVVHEAYTTFDITDSIGKNCRECGPQGFNC